MVRKDAVCNVQVMFFVGVQLDITAPATPTAAAAAQPALSPFAPADNAGPSIDSAEAAIADVGGSHTAQQSGLPMSPAASQQIQSQVNYCSNQAMPRG